MTSGRNYNYAIQFEDKTIEGSADSLQKIQEVVDQQISERIKVAKDYTKKDTKLNFPIVITEVKPTQGAKKEPDSEATLNVNVNYDYSQSTLEIDIASDSPDYSLNKRIETEFKKPMPSVSALSAGGSKITIETTTPQFSSLKDEDKKRVFMYAMYHPPIEDPVDLTQLQGQSKESLEQIKAESMKPEYRTEDFFFGGTRSKQIDESLSKAEKEEDQKLQNKVVDDVKQKPERSQTQINPERRGRIASAARRLRSVTQKFRKTTTTASVQPTDENILKRDEKGSPEQVVKASDDLASIMEQLRPLAEQEQKEKEIADEKERQRLEEEEKNQQVQSEHADVSSKVEESTITREPEIQVESQELPAADIAQMGPVPPISEIPKASVEPTVAESATVATDSTSEAPKTVKSVFDLMEESNKLNVELQSNKTSAERKETIRKDMEDINKQIHESYGIKTAEATSSIEPKKSEKQTEMQETPKRAETSKMHASVSVEDILKKANYQEVIRYAELYKVALEEAQKGISKTQKNDERAAFNQLSNKIFNSLIKNEGDFSQNRDTLRKDIVDLTNKAKHYNESKKHQGSLHKFIVKRKKGLEKKISDWRNRKATEENRQLEQVQASAISTRLGEVDELIKSLNEGIKHIDGKLNEELKETIAHYEEVKAETDNHDKEVKAETDKIVDQIFDETPEDSKQSKHREEMDLDDLVKELEEMGPPISDTEKERLAKADLSAEVDEIMKGIYGDETQIKKKVTQSSEPEAPKATETSKPRAATSPVENKENKPFADSLAVLGEMEKEHEAKAKSTEAPKATEIAKRRSATLGVSVRSEVAKWNKITDATRGPNGCRFTENKTEEPTQKPTPMPTFKKGS